MPPTTVFLIPGHSRKLSAGRGVAQPSVRGHASDINSRTAHERNLKPIKKIAAKAKARELEQATESDETGNLAVHNLLRLIRRIRTAQGAQRRAAVTEARETVKALLRGEAPIDESQIEIIRAAKDALTQVPFTAAGPCCTQTPANVKAARSGTM